MEGVLPNIADRTTTGVDARSDSPFFRLESATTRPLNNRVEVAITVSPFPLFLGYPYKDYSQVSQDTSYFRILFVQFFSESYH